MIDKPNWVKATEKAALEKRLLCLEKKVAALEAVLAKQGKFLREVSRGGPRY